MDAAQSSFKKLFFFLATALLLTAPFHASAQTLALNSTTVAIGSSGCNDSQNITISSSNGTNVTFTVAVQYNSPNPYGNWLFAGLTYGGGSTSSSTTFPASTGTSGVSLTIGLNTNNLAANSDIGQVILTPTSGSSTTPITITVDYTNNTSCGGNGGAPSNGFISVSPGNIALSAATNGSGTQTVTIQDISGGGYVVVPTVSPSNSWLSVSTNSVSLTAGESYNITVTGNATKTNGVGTYTGSLVLTAGSGYTGTTLNIPVTFTVGSGSGSGSGGNSSGTLSVNGGSSAIIAFNYVFPNVPGGQCVNLVDTQSGVTTYSWSVSTTSGGNWLLANNSFSGSTPQILAPGTYPTPCINLTLNPAIAASLASGAYQGSVVVSDSSGSSATITANLYISGGVANGITVVPGAIYVFPNVAPGSGTVQQATFTVSGVTGYSVGSPSLANGGTDFSVSNTTANNNSISFTVTSNTTGLIAGVYSSTITVPSNYNGGASANTTITVVQPVGQSGSTTTGGTTTVVAPTQLSFQEQQGDSFWTGGKEAQAVTVTGTQGSQWNATIVYSAGASGWLNVDSGTSGTFGNGPATLLVDLFNSVSSLATGTYQATVDITTTSGLYQVNVSLLVTAQNVPVLLGIPASVTFSENSGANPSSQNVTVVGSDNTGSPNSPPITTGSPSATWLSATTTGNTLTLSVNGSALTTGVYAATIPVMASAYANAINYPVVLVVNGGGSGTTGGSGPLTLSSTALTYTNVTGSIVQDLNVTASTTTLFTLSSSETSCQGSNWLTVTNGSYSASSTQTQIAVTVNPTGIANGTTCQGVITLISTGTNGGTQTVTVSMTVATSSGTGNVTVSPTSLTFAYTQGQTVPAAQTVTVVNATSGTASIPFTVSTTETNGTTVQWLVPSVTSATTPYNNPGLSISVAPGSLPPATYTGTVTITPNGGSAQTISVTMTVSNTATVTATPTSVTWSYLVGGAAPTGATIQVAAGGATAGFTATAASTGGWLQVTPTSGTTPNTGTTNLTVSTVASALAALAPSATAYTGTITVQGVTQGSNQATGTTVINVSLTVTAPLPVISSVINAASGVGGTGNVTIAPGEIISLFAPSNGQNPFGPASSVALSSATCPSPCTSVPTTMGGVQLLFLPGNFAAPLLYVSANQINAVVPYQVAGIGNLSVEVKYLGQSSNAFPLTVAATAPGIFASAGSTQAAAYEYSPQGQGNYNSTAAPASAGWTLVLYVTGEGVVVPAANTGAVTVAASTPPYTPVPAAGAPTVRIGNQPATVSFYGEAPGFVSGLMQLNVLVPSGAGTGSVPVSITIGGNSTQAGVTVALQ